MWGEERSSTTIICDKLAINLLAMDFVPLPNHHLLVIAMFLRPGSSKNARKFNAYFALYFC